MRPGTHNSNVVDKIQTSEESICFTHLTMDEEDKDHHGMLIPVRMKGSQRPSAVFFPEQDKDQMRDHLVQTFLRVVPLSSGTSGWSDRCPNMLWKTKPGEVMCQYPGGETGRATNTWLNRWELPMGPCATARQVKSEDGDWTVGRCADERNKLWEADAVHVYLTIWDLSMLLGSCVPGQIPGRSVFLMDQSPKKLYGIIRVSSPDVPVQTRLDETADFEVEDRVKSLNRYEPGDRTEQKEEPDFYWQIFVKEDGETGTQILLECDPVHRSNRNTDRSSRTGTQDSSQHTQEHGQVPHGQVQHQPTKPRV
ncbi:hypothetical protein Bbelb_137830 [Branchiostoma belcheri]|nr:hypothetical protein Bbelb_137830 [Branchiostoma belcheri]